MARADRFFNGIPYWLEGQRERKSEAQALAKKLRGRGFGVYVVRAYPASGWEVYASSSGNTQEWAKSRMEREKEPPFGYDPILAEIARHERRMRGG